MPQTKIDCREAGHSFWVRDGFVFCMRCKVKKRKSHLNFYKYKKGKAREQLFYGYRISDIPFLSTLKGH